MRIVPTSVLFTILLGSLGALPPLCIDMGLPALPLLQRSLAATTGDAGLTLSLFMAGFAAAQLGLGPLSDRIGRRPVMIAGLTVFTLAGFGCASATSMIGLVLFRLLQGMGAASGTVLAFAIVRDLFDGNAMRTKLSYVTMVLSIAPIIAPTLGSWLLLLGSWRLIFVTLASAGLVLTIIVTLGLGETRRVIPGAVPLRWATGYRIVLGNRRSIGYALVNAFSSGDMFAYVAGSPLLMIGTLGISTQLYGVLFACTAGGIVVGAWINGRISSRGVSASGAMIAAQLVSVATALLLVLLTAAGMMSLFLLMPLLIVNVGSRGIIAPTASHAALAPMPEQAGVMSAVLGFLQMAAGSVASIVVMLLYRSYGPVGMMATMLIFAVASLAMAGLVREPAMAATTRGDTAARHS